MEEILQDSRFAHIVKDPRFRRIPRYERKVKIDKRFQSMFKDKKFKVKYTIDKRGRPANTSSAEDLKRYYDISTSDDDSDSGSNEEDMQAREKLKKNKLKIKKKKDNDKVPATVNRIIKDGSSASIKQHKECSKSSSVGGGDDYDNDDNDDENDELSDNGALSDKVKDKLHDMTIDYARGEGVLLSDSSSDEDSDSEDAEQASEELEHDWGELDKDAETTQQATRRLAICNMDWDRVRAQDLLVLLSSFLPKTGGAIQRVSIYPSEFGLQRMKEEEVKGPLELCDSKKTNTDDDVDEEENENEEEAEEGRRYHMEKLRRYQLNRLRYFYAIAECDSVVTAESVYNECDGLEYESSATKLDLRFVPDDMIFEQEPRDTCDTLPEPGKYAPKLFTTTALQQAKVELTWDETDPQRVDVARKLQAAKSIDDINDTDLQAYLASSGSDDEEQEDKSNAEKNDSLSEAEEESKNGDSLSRYRLLLEEAERQEQAKKKKSEDVQMEVTWGLGLKEKTEKMVKERLKSGGTEATPFEQMLAKKREKKRQRKEERKKLKQPQENRQEENDSDVPFSDDDIPSDIDMNDPYFKEELKDMMPKKNKKTKRKYQYSDADENEEEKQRKAELELLMLEDDGEDNKKHFSLKSIQEAESGSKKKKKKKKLGKKMKREELPADTEDKFQVNVNDERFAALFSSHHYSIDPTDPHYRHTKGMEALRTAKLQRRQLQEEGEQVKLEDSSSKQKDTTLSQLVKSVKMKTRGLVK